MDGRECKNIMSGKRVDRVLTEDQRTGKLTEGIVHNRFTENHDFTKATHRIQTLSDLLTLLP